MIKRTCPYVGMRASALMLLLIVSAACCSCATDNYSQQKSPVDKEIKTLLVVPFKNQAVLRGENVTYRCNLCGSVFTTSTVENGADAILTENVIQLLSNRQAIVLVPSDRIGDIREQQLLDNESKPSRQLSLLVEIGKKLGADAVLTGSIYRWIDRSGSNFATDVPASVGFDLDLVDTKTAQIIWHARFDESQQHLSDNLLKLGTFLKRGAKWVTARDLAVEGLKDLLERSPIP